MRGQAALGAAAGLGMGSLWGYVAAQPETAYFFALPGEPGEVIHEWSVLALGPWVRAPGRTAALVVSYALAAGLAGLALGAASARVKRVGTAIDGRPLHMALVVAGLATALLCGMWLRRGIRIDAVGLGSCILAALASGGLGGFLLPRLASRLADSRLLRNAALATVALALGAWILATPRPTIRESQAPLAEPTPRLLLVGVDAASWANLEAGIRGGSLPNFAKLRGRGAYGDLQSLHPTLSPVVWTTIATGARPEQHGILDFALRGVPYTSNSRRSFALWELLSEHGRRSAFHYWWASWPAENIDGRIVTDRLLDRELDERVSPAQQAALLDALAKRAAAGAARALDVLDVEAGALPTGFAERHASKLAVLDDILARDEIVTALGEAALAEDFDVVAVYLRAPDAVGHKYWRWHWHRSAPWLADRLYGPPDADQDALAGAVQRVDEIVDSQLGRLLEAAGASWNVVIVSDHGMAGSIPLEAEAGGEGETGGHHRSGMILLAGPDIRAGSRIGGATVYDVFPTVLYLLGLPIPDAGPGRVLAEAIAPATLDARPELRMTSRGRRDVGDPTPIATGADQRVLDQLRALGYVIDDDAPSEP